MAQPIVSVLMTAYNRQEYIAQAIESVLASQFGDFELIIVDDRSTDQTLEIARRYAADARVQVHVNETNLGDYPNRNRAAAPARGKYLEYLDSDDVIYPHGLEAMVAALERFPEAAFGLERPEAVNQTYPAALTPDLAYREHFLSNGLFGCGPTGAIIRTECFRAVGGFRELRMVGDFDLWLRLGARYATVKFSQGFIWWRRHEGQEFATQTGATMAAEFRIALEALEATACPLPAVAKAEAARRTRWAFARMIWHHALRKGRVGHAAELFRNSNLSAGQLLRGMTPLRPVTGGN